MATGWLRGVIKEVPSGDTLVIVGTAKQGPPPEKRITLSSLIAPKLVRNKQQREAGALNSAADDALGLQMRLRCICYIYINVV